MEILNREPTQEEVTKLWEWCGFTTTLDGHGVTQVVAPDGAWLSRLPDIGLDSLFQWAVPKLISKVGKHRAYLLLSGCLSSAILQDKKLEEEIFRAIGKVREDK